MDAFAGADAARFFCQGVVVGTVAEHDLDLEPAFAATRLVLVLVHSQHDLQTQTVQLLDTSQVVLGVADVHVDVVLL